MEVNVGWLAEFVKVPEVETLCDLLTRVGIEVESVRNPAAHHTGVVVGLIEACEPHPKAGKLQVCQVNDGSTSYTVVCGAPNARPGLRVAFAKVGAELGDVQIGKRSLRGIKSQGMLCSEQELGLSGPCDGLWELPADWPLGTSVFEAADITPTLDLGITPNRPDLLSHVGVAREVAAGLGASWTRPTVEVLETGSSISTEVQVQVEDKEACPRYVTRVVRNVRVGPSPRWLRQRLEAVGQRSINNVVDVTNYVLFELGHPLHAFDLDRLSGAGGIPTIQVRSARPRENLTTLDNVERELDPDDLVIADAERAVALAGVIGGADSEVSESTTNILLESACFQPQRVRRAARRAGLHTEASHRFERGADLGILELAADRCVQLLQKVAGGEVATGRLDVSVSDEGPREIALRLGRVKAILGVALSEETVVTLLEPLEILCRAREEGRLFFVVPSFRVDITREIDLVEEIARRYGYDNIQARLPDSSTPAIVAGQLPHPFERAREALLSTGLSEAVTFGFGPSAHYEEDPLVSILNPLGEDYRVLRSRLLPNLLQVAAHNQRHGHKQLRFFEIGTVVRARNSARDEPAADPRDRLLPQEETHCAFIMAGGRYEGSWYEAGAAVDFSDVAGVLENIAHRMELGEELSRRPKAAEGFNPHAAAEIVLGGHVVGFAGQIHPVRLAAFNLEGPVYAAEFTLSGMMTVAARRLAFGGLPRYPCIRRDVAVVAPRALSTEKLRRFLADYAGGDLGIEVVEAVRIFDVYTGPAIPKDRVSLAFAIEYRARDRTLTDDEVGPAFEAVLARLKQVFDISIRS